MTATSYLDYEAPEGWSNLTAAAPYDALIGLNVQVICKSGGGGVWWGGASTPVGSNGISLSAESSDYETAVAEVWLKGPANYAITQRG
jgi:hypothetical protein